MSRPLTLAEHTLLAELIEKSFDSMFDDQFPENGSFIKRAVSNREGVREYYYYQGYRPKTAPSEKAVRSQKYVGPADDPAIAARVERFHEIKAGRTERASLVQALTGLGLARPPVIMGRIIEGLAKAGLFRLRAVLIGTAAYQTYPALTGMRLDQASVMTGDVDIAQFRSISIGVEDQSAPILDTLKSIDASFRALPHKVDPVATTTFQNAAGFRLDVLTPHRGSDDQMGNAIRMNALPGAAAEPLRFLDYLLHKPVRSVVLYGPGISVNVPAPERFAIHKIILATRRRADATGTAKARKDLLQADEIITAFVETARSAELRDAFREAWNRGPNWRLAISAGARRLPDNARSALSTISEGALERLP